MIKKKDNIKKIKNYLTSFYDFYISSNKKSIYLFDAEN